VRSGSEEKGERETYGLFINIAIFSDMGIGLLRIVSLLLLAFALVFVSNPGRGPELPANKVVVGREQVGLGEWFPLEKLRYGVGKELEKKEGTRLFCGWMREEIPIPLIFEVWLDLLAHFGDVVEGGADPVGGVLGAVVVEP
jgi:hypothetical protein